MAKTAKATLTNVQRFSVEQARMLIARPSAELYAEECPEMSEQVVCGRAEAYALGRLTPYVTGLLAIIDELTGGAQ